MSNPLTMMIQSMMDSPEENDRKFEEILSTQTAVQERIKEDQASTFRRPAYWQMFRPLEAPVIRSKSTNHNFNNMDGFVAQCAEWENEAKELKG